MSWRKSGPGDGRIAQVLLGSTGTGLLERGVSLSRRPSRDSGALPRKEREAEFRRRREFERGFTCLSNVAQQQTGEPLGQRTPKGSSGLGSFIATRIALLMASRC